MSDIVERKIGGLTVRIDRSTCIASEDCMAVAPELFELDDESICSFRDPAGKVDRDRVIESCRVCPVDALIVLEADGRQVVP